MNDLESRLTTALREKGENAPVAADLAGSARERRRWQIRTRYGTGLGVAAAVAAAVLIVPGAIGGGEDPDGSGPVLTTEGRDWIPAGWRVETVGEVELAVPGDMPYGDLTQACIGPQVPVFYRSGGVSTAVACPTAYGEGVMVTTDEITARDFPAEVELRTKAVGDRTVVVALADGALADRIIATAHRNDGIDANGCPTTEPIPAIGVAGTVGATEGRISVCRYSAGERANLLQSELLDESASASLRNAITDAPAGMGPDAGREECLDLDDEGEQEAVMFRTETGPLAWVHYDRCRGHALDLGGSTKQLTAGIMHWALSPGWSGGISVNGLMSDLRPDPNQKSLAVNF